MQPDKQERRRQQIRAAAYELLEEKGYKAASMLAIAKRAKASNETLYAWYGNKQQLFDTLIQENAQDVARALQKALDTRTDIETALHNIGPLLLKLVTSNKAIALTRAAAADVSDSGALGQSLASMGRNTIGPLVQQVFDQARLEGSLQFADDDAVTEVYFGLLIGDTQVRRATGALALLSKAQIEARATRALELIMRLYSTSDT